MTFSYWADRTDKRVRHSEFNNFALVNKNFLINGCAVTAAGTNMNVDVAEGKIFIAGDIINVSAGSVTLTASDPSNDRYDIIAINASGTIIKIDGTPGTPPATPNYTEEDYVVLAGVIVQDGVTTIATADVQSIGIESEAFSKVNKGTVDPASGVIGELFYNTTSATLKYYDGVAWEEVGTGSGGGLGKYTTTFTTATSVTVTHNLDDANPVVQVYDNTNELITPDKIEIIDNNNVTITFNSSTTGFVVVHGGLAVVVKTGTTAYYSQNFTSQTSVTVTHNLGLKYVLVKVYNDIDEEIEAESVTLTDDDNLVVTFGVATTGKVVVAGGTTAANPVGKADFLPDTNNAYDIGSSTHKWKDAYFAGKLTVDGGIDPIYLQLTPQADDSEVLNNSLWIDSSDSNKLKIKDNVGVVEEIVQGTIGTAANNIVALDGDAKLPVVDGSQLTNLPATDIPTIDKDLQTIERSAGSGTNTYTYTVPDNKRWVLMTLGLWPGSNDLHAIRINGRAYRHIGSALNFTGLDNLYLVLNEGESFEFYTRHSTSHFFATYYEVDV